MSSSSSSHGTPSSSSSSSQPSSSSSSSGNWSSSSSSSTQSSSSSSNSSSSSDSSTSSSSSCSSNNGCVESTKGRWYNAYLVVDLSDLMGADGSIDTRSPHLDCEPTGNYTDASVVFVGATQQPANGPVERWAQVGWVRGRSNGTTTIQQRIYSESRVGQNPADYHRFFGNSPDPGSNRYTCNMIVPANGISITTALDLILGSMRIGKMPPAIAST